MTEEQPVPEVKTEKPQNKRLIIEFNLQTQRWTIVHSDFNILEMRELAREILEIFSGKVGGI